VRGGGIWAGQALSLSNVTLAGNSAGGSSADDAAGGGLWQQSGELSLVNVDLYANSVEADLAQGGGLFTSASSGKRVSVVNTNMVSNSATGEAPAGSAMALSGDTTDVSVEIRYSNLTLNDGEPLSGVDDPSPEDGNIEEYPDYVDVRGSDPAAWDLSLAVGSPCIDAGDPDLLDVDSSPSDIGAFGGPAGDWE
jgi:hypothetical protein